VPPAAAAPTHGGNVARGVSVADLEPAPPSAHHAGPHHGADAAPAPPGAPSRPISARAAAHLHATVHRPAAAATRARPSLPSLPSLRSTALEALQARPSRTPDGAWLAGLGLLGALLLVQTRRRRST
jgi:MYXO-CTERM domain-containing protein